MNPLQNRKQEIVAEVPMSEMGDFPTAMRSIAQGRALFEFNFERYEEAPPFISQKVIIADMGRKKYTFPIIIAIQEERL